MCSIREMSLRDDMMYLANDSLTSCSVLQCVAVCCRVLQSCQRLQGGEDA